MMNTTAKPLLLAGLLAFTAAAHAHGDRQVYSTFALERLEMRNSNTTGNSSYWEGQGWAGSDTDKFWLKTQGDARNGKAQAADLQLLYSRALTPFWDFQLGVRHDMGLNGLPERNRAALAWKGVTPYKFDMDASLYLGRGAAARIKTGYTLLLTQKLALLPEVEANWYSADDPARNIGSALSSLDMALRLKYEVTREFAPYIGVNWANKYGSTASFARANGEPASDVSYNIGVRLWW